MILWGDPGSGKTSLAHVISRSTKAHFEPFNAVLGGVAQVRELVKEATLRKSSSGTRTVLFVDEIHRFNRAQQDAFLPHVENGTIILIGATTENPSFNVNGALLSRSKILHLQPLSEADLSKLLTTALTDQERGLGTSGVEVTPQAIEAIARAARGDARRALNQLENAVGHVARSQQDAPRKVLDAQLLERIADDPALLYDKSGEEHYNVTSAFIKSMRATDPDAAIYWMLRMVDAGEDPLFVMRRMIIFASEDVGNADPRALAVATSADQALRRVGMPEGVYPLAHACLYLACCPKSDGVKRAIGAARAAIADSGALPVPLKLRNAPTRIMREEGYGEGYRYPHDYEGHVVPGEQHLPERLADAQFYFPSHEGLERQIHERLQRLGRRK